MSRIENIFKKFKSVQTKTKTSEWKKIIIILHIKYICIAV